MEEIILYAKAQSQEAPYKVTFIIDKDKMKVQCDCPAGRFGKFCKHKFNFLKGNDVHLYYKDDDDQYDLLERISDLIQSSELLDYIIYISKINREIASLEEKSKSIHKEAGNLMKTGISL